MIEKNDFQEPKKKIKTEGEKEELRKIEKIEVQELNERIKERDI